MTTTFTLDLNTALTQVLAQQGGGTTTRFLPGIGQEVNGAWQYLHADALGNVRHVTDATGAVLGSRRYSPFGEVVAGSGNLSPLGFTGQPQDATSGLTYLRARYYNAAQGRFLTPDAIVPDAANGQAWNAYAYVYNDVVNLVDPSGFAPGPLSGVTGFIDDIGGGISSPWSNFTNWWNKPSCDCSSSSKGWFAALVSNYKLGSDGIGTYVGSVATAAITVATRHITTQFQVRDLNWSLKSKGNAEGVSIERGSVDYSDPKIVKQTTRTASSLELKPGKSGISTSNVVSARYGSPLSQTITHVRNVINWRGVATATGWGAVFSGVGQVVQDLFDAPCLTPRQRAARGLTEFGYGVIPAAVGALTTAGLVAVGTAPLLAMGGGILLGVVVTKLVSAARKEYDLPQWEIP